MKRNFLMGIAIFTSLYIFTFLVDIATYLIAYNNLIKVEQLVCYYYEEYGYIPLSYLTKINKRDIYIYSNKDFYLEGEEIEYKIECKLEDGNLCKNCAKKLSPFFNERRSSTVDEITTTAALGPKK